MFWERDLSMHRKEELHAFAADGYWFVNKENTACLSQENNNEINYAENTHNHSSIDAEIVNQT